MQQAPDATAAFERTPPVQNLLSSLLREHRLTSTTVLQVYLTDLGVILDPKASLLRIERSVDDGPDQDHSLRGL